MKKTIAIIALAVSVVSGCATTSLEGLTKDQIAKREESRSAWSAWGRTAANVALNLGVGWVNANRGNEESLESNKGFRK